MAIATPEEFGYYSHTGTLFVWGIAFFAAEKRKLWADSDNLGSAYHTDKGTHYQRYDGKYHSVCFDQAVEEMKGFRLAVEMRYTI